MKMICILCGLVLVEEGCVCAECDAWVLGMKNKKK